VEVEQGNKFSQVKDCERLKNEVARFIGWKEQQKEIQEDRLKLVHGLQSHGVG
jgi:hypothetical protein